MPAEQQPQSSDGVVRFRELLGEVARRWSSLPAPRIAASGRPPQAVLHGATEEEVVAAADFVAGAALLPPTERPDLFERRIAAGGLTEVDLWALSFFVAEAKVPRPGEAAVLLEVWLQWAEALGRKDALLFIAGEMVELSLVHADPQPLRALVGDLSELPLPAEAAWCQAKLLLDHAHLLQHVGELRAALAGFRRAGGLFADLSDPLRQGDALTGEGMVLAELGEYEAARTAYRAAGQVFSAQGDRRGRADSVRGEADVLFLLGEVGGAIELYRQVTSWYEELREPISQASSLVHQGRALIRLGHNEEALRAYRHARGLYQQIGNTRGVADTLLAEADLAQRLHHPERALATRRAARQLLHTVGATLREADALLGEADLVLALGQGEEALALYRATAGLYAGGGSALGLANSRHGEAHARFQLGDLTGAREALRAARARFAATGEPLGEANSFLLEGEIAARQDEWPAAAVAARRAADLFQRIAAQDQVAALVLLAVASANQGELAAAEQAAQEAIRVHGRWRSTRITDADRTALDLEIAAAYDLLVLLRARTDPQAALTLAEEARSRVLLDLIAAVRERPKPAVPAAPELQVQRELWRVGEEMSRAADPGAQLALLARQDELDREIEWQRYERLASRPASLLTAPPLDAAAIGALAREVGPILIFHSAGPELWGFLVRPESDVLLHRLATSRQDLATTVRAFTRDLANPLFETRSRTAARELWDALIAPFAGSLPAGGPLTVVPHGVLYEVPFEALLDSDGQPFFTRWDVSVAPSASALVVARRRHHPPLAGDSFVALAGPGVPDLDVSALAGLVGGRPEAVVAVDLPTYVARATSARQLLFLTRGVHAQGSRTGTYLEVRPSREAHDGRLTMAEIATYPLAAELVALVACDTSYGPALMSGERLDLSRAFFLAGTAAILATRWKVPADDRTSRFLVDFYRLYRRGGTAGSGLRKDQALSAARRLARQRGDPAQVWSAWVLLGDPR